MNIFTLSGKGTRRGNRFLFLSFPGVFLTLFSLFCSLGVAKAQNTLTVYDGTVENSYVPVNGLNVDLYQKCEFVIPASGLSYMNGGTISKMTFYLSSSAAASWDDARFCVFLKEVDETTLSSYSGLSGATIVYEGALDGTQTTMEIEFSDYFTYDGGNLLVGVYQTAKGIFKNASFYGQAVTGASVHGYSPSSLGEITANQRNFIPKTTFTYITGSGPVYNKPQGLTAGGISDTGATLNWSISSNASASGLTGYTYQYKTADAEWGTGNTTEGTTTGTSVTLSGLTAKTGYDFRVKADYGDDGTSDWSSISFRTTGVPQPVGNGWSDGFEGSSCGWETVNGDLTNKWVWGDAVSKGGDKALYISNDNGETNAYTANKAAMVYAIKLLGFNEGKYEFSYDWKANGETSGGTGYDFLRVALVPGTVELAAATDAPSGFSSSALPSGWIALDGGGVLNQVTDWQNRIVAVDVPAGNYYMVFAWCNDIINCSNPPAAIDNFSVRPITCSALVEGLNIVDITTDGASLSWTGGIADQWQVAYSTNVNFEGATQAIVNNTTHNITGLSPDTHYYVKVRAYCDGSDYGIWSDVLQFNTDCIAITTFPWTENFDGYTVASNTTVRTLPNCWGAINTSTYNANINYPTVYYSSYINYACSSPNCLRLYSSYSSNSNNDPQDQYVILPRMKNLNGKTISLNVRGYNTSSTFRIGMMTDPDNVSTFTEIAEQDGLTTSYQEFEYTLTEGSYVAIMIEAANSILPTNGVYIDDITIDEAPACPKPKGLTVSNVRNHHATLDWIEKGSATIWQICLNGDEEDPVTVNEKPYTLSTLKPETEYTVKVRAVSGSDVSPWSSAVSFTTIEAWPAPDGLAVSEIDRTSVKLSWNETGDATSWVIGYNTADDTGFTETNADTNPFTLTGLDMGTAYTVKVRPHTDDLSIKWSSTVNFTTLVSCPAPTGLVVSGITHNSAKLSWTENYTATSWQICLNNNEEELIDVNTNPFMLTGLNSSTANTVKVRAVGNEEYSAWTPDVSFRTTVVPQPVESGWSDGFEGSSCGWELVNGNLTNNWVWGNAVSKGGDKALYISNDNGETNAYTVSKAAMVYATKLLGFNEGKYEFSYDWKANGETSGGTSYDFLRVALVPVTVELAAATLMPTGFSSSALPSGWIALDGGGVLNQITGWQNRTVAVDVPAGNFYMVFVWRNDGSNGNNPPAAIDNFSVRPITCSALVEGLNIVDITTDGASLSWTGGIADQWQVAYSTNVNFEGATQAIVSNAAYEITGLSPGTHYYVRVRACCGGNDFGLWSDVLQFNTDCMAVTTFPWTENFDGYAVASGNYPSARTLPVCWAAVNTCTNSTYNVFPTVLSYENYAHSSPNCLRLYSSYSSNSNNDPQDQYVILPRMKNLNGKTISLNVRGYNTSSTFRIGMMTDPDNVSTFTEIAEQDGLTTSYQEFEYTLTEGSYVAIMIEAANSSWPTNGVYIDDITIDDTCLRPTGLTVSNVRNHLATLDWTENGQATAWQICLNDDESALINVGGTTYTLTNLNAKTAYTAKVRAWKSDTEQSRWSNQVSFTTLVSCPAPTGLAATLTPGNGTVAALGWTENGTATAWEICIDDDESNLISVTDDPVYNLTNLTPETAYTVKVRAVNSVEEKSEWTAPVSFTPTNAYSITVNDGTVTSSYVPVYGYYADYMIKSQFIIPKADLSRISSGIITKLTFYASASSASWGDAMFEVYMTEVDNTTFPSTTLKDWADMEKVMNAGTLSVIGNKMEVTLDVPYQYMGGNLLIGFNQTVSGSLRGFNWYGVTANSASLGGYSTQIFQQSFLPKTTLFYYDPSSLPTVTLTEDGGVTELATYSGRAVEAVFTRPFTQNVASTVCLPFPMTGVSGGTLYEFVDVTYDSADGWVATMQAANLAETPTVANQPYLFMPGATGDVTFSGVIASVPATVTAGSTTSAYSGGVDWTFQGTYTNLVYGTNLNGKVFGFAATGGDGKDAEDKDVSITAGEFVRAANGATVKPFRAYLTYSGSDEALQAPGRGVASTPAIPDRIKVRLLGSDGTVTAVGTMDMRTGDVMTGEWYDMYGRRLDGAPIGPGLYINNGRKVMIK